MVAVEENVPKEVSIVPAAVATVAVCPEVLVLTKYILPWLPGAVGSGNVTVQVVAFTNIIVWANVVFAV